MNKGLILLMVCVGSLCAQTRPRDPFVFRTALAEGATDRPSANKNRLIAVLLNTNFTAFYSTQNGSLYQTRTGVANDGNDTYDQTVFGQCLQFEGGVVLHKNTAPQMWAFLNNGTPTTSKTIYKGFTLTGTTVAIRYAIVAGVNTINISEVPEFAAGGLGGIKRIITVTGLATNQSVRLQVNGGVATESWTSTGGGTVSGTNPMYLTITANGATTLTGTWN